MIFFFFGSAVAIRKTPWVLFRVDLQSSLFTTWSHICVAHGGRYRCYFLPLCRTITKPVSVSIPLVPIKKKDHNNLAILNPALERNKSIKLISWIMFSHWLSEGAGDKRIFVLRRLVQMPSMEVLINPYICAHHHGSASPCCHSLCTGNMEPEGGGKWSRAPPSLLHPPPFRAQATVSPVQQTNTSLHSWKRS